MSARRFSGRPASPGLARGDLVVLTAPAVSRRSTGDPAQEAEALRGALARATAELTALAAASRGDAGDVLGFQVALLEDPALAEPALERVSAGVAAHQAWAEALDAEAAGYEAAADELFRARGADLRDLRDRVLGQLSGERVRTEVPPGAIVAAVDLAPSRFLAVDWSHGGALALTGGSPTSHVAMLARAREIPAVVGLGIELAALATAPGVRCPALLDGNQGELVLDPGDDDHAGFERERERLAAARAAWSARARQPAATRDGTPIRVLLNVSDPRDLEGVDPELCDGVGLVRTELLFGGEAGLPGEEAQLESYRRVVEWARGRPVTIRTLDAGGDKPVAGLTLPGEANPFLGVRGVRLSLAVPEVFRAQLRALARAAALGPVKVMLPMVTAPHELHRVRALLDAEVAALAAAGVAARRPPLGIMIEVPAAALTADLFDAEFYSVGTNDLAQYVAAAARDAAGLASLADPVQPAMLRLLRVVVAAAAARGVELTLCGDAGAEPAAIPRLLRAGLRALSVAPARVGEVKQVIAETDLGGPESTEEGAWPR
jgi:phosphotransferase system enzyme I (PtsI)